VKIKQNSIISNIKKNGFVIKVNVEDCEVVNYDKMVHLNSYKGLNENYSLIKHLNYDPLYNPEILNKQSKLICKLKSKGKLKKQYIGYYNIDSTILEFNLKREDFIYIYESKQNNLKYYIDLDFLKKQL
jgi:hypothetical protein